MKPSRSARTAEVRCCREYDADEVLSRVKYYLEHCKNGEMNITFKTKIESEEDR